MYLPRWQPLVCFAVLVATAAGAGGPRRTTPAGDPIVWDNTGPITYFVDQGTLGNLSNEAARELIQLAFETWASVEGVSLQITPAQLLEIDVTGSNVDSGAYPSTGEGVSTVLLDDDGTILDNLLMGMSDHVLGLTRYKLTADDEIKEVQVILNGECLDGDSGGEICEQTYVEFQATVLHEIGHFLGLDHTDLNRGFVGDGRVANNAALPTMYPLQSEDDSSLLSPHLDDALAMARLYPSAGGSLPPTVLQGRVLDKLGQEYDGANVVVRNLADPFEIAATAVSGDVRPPGGMTNRAGSWRIEGLPEGNYSVEVRPIAAMFSGDLHVGQQNIEGPVVLGATPEFLSDPGEEGADALVDFPGDRRIVRLRLSPGMDEYTDLDIRFNDIQLLTNELAGSGNSADTATPVGPDPVVVGDLVGSGDVDYYSIVVPVGWTLEADIDAADGGPGTALDSALDALLGLYKQCGCGANASNFARFWPPSSQWDTDCLGCVPAPEAVGTADPATGLQGPDGAVLYDATQTEEIVIAVTIQDDDDFDGLPADPGGPYYLRITPSAPVARVSERLLGGGGAAANPGAGFVLTGGIPTTLGAPAGNGQIIASTVVAATSCTDADGDGLCDPLDPCPNSPDTDDDGICNRDDNCDFVQNIDQRDGDGDDLGDRCDAPSVLLAEVSPGNRATQVPLSSTMTVVFSEPIDVASIPGSFSVEFPAATPIGLETVSWDPERRRIALDPSASLQGSATHEIVVTTALTDDDGQPLVDLPGMPGIGFVSEFTTRLDPTAQINAETIGTEYSGNSQNGSSLGSRHGAAVAAGGDVNGDGANDLLVGAPRGDGGIGQPDAGRVALYFGASDAVTSGPARPVIFVGEQTGDRAGRSVAFVSDVNQDGIGDFMIGAPQARPDGVTQAGVAYLVFGSASLPSVVDDVDLSTLADVDCTVCGIIFGGTDAGDSVGRSLSTAGDFNVDNVPDLLIGAPGCDPPSRTDAGIVYLVFGGSDLADEGSFDLSTVGMGGPPGIQFLGEFEGDSAGVSVSDWPDRFGDGADDILIGSPLADVNPPDPDTDPTIRTDAGVVYAMMGMPEIPSGEIDLRDAADPLLQETLPSIVFLGTMTDGRAGWSVWGRGDVNGDDEPDILIGSPGASFDGVIEGGAAFLVPTRAIDDDGPKQASGSSTDLSPTQTGGGATSQPSNSMRQNGTDENLGEDSDGTTFQGVNSGDKAGTSVATIADVTGDGIPEILIGASGFDRPPPTESLAFAGAADTNEGAVYLVAGLASRSNTSMSLDAVGVTEPGLQIVGETANGNLGEAVTGTGDLDDSGSPEIVAGAPGDEDAPPDNGTVYITTPLVSAEPRALRLARAPHPTLEWLVTPGATRYSVYRGDLSDLDLEQAVRTSLAACLAPGGVGVGDADGDGKPDFDDPAEPGAGSGFWYLVTGGNAAGEGPLGTDTEGNLRINDKDILTCP